MPGHFVLTNSAPLPGFIDVGSEDFFFFIIVVLDLWLFGLVQLLLESLSQQIEDLTGVGNLQLVYALLDVRVYFLIDDLVLEFWIIADEFESTIAPALLTVRPMHIDLQILIRVYHTESLFLYNIIIAGERDTLIAASDRRHSAFLYWTFDFTARCVDLLEGKKI